jgi:hypothetical protein
MLFGFSCLCQLHPCYQPAEPRQVRRSRRAGLFYGTHARDESTVASGGLTNIGHISCAAGPRFRFMASRLNTDSIGGSAYITALRYA